MSTSVTVATSCLGRTATFSFNIRVMGKTGRLLQMELLGELLGFVITDILISGIGWICLFVWYRNKRKMEYVRDKKYAGSYSAAGGTILLNAIAGAGALSLLGIILFFLGLWAYDFIIK